MPFPFEFARLNALQAAIRYSHKPDPGNFRSGILKKNLSPSAQQLHGNFISLIHAYNSASLSYRGTNTQNWNTSSSVFIWLIFNVELLTAAPQHDKTNIINGCVAHRLNMFCCERVASLWQETRAVSSRKPNKSCTPTASDCDRAVRETANKDNFWMAYARAVKPQAIATITPANRHIIAAMYPKRISTQHLHPQCLPPALFIILPSHAPPATLDLPVDIITSILHQNKGQANGLCMDSIDIFIRLANRNSSDTKKALRLYCLPTYGMHIHEARCSSLTFPTTRNLLTLLLEPQVSMRSYGTQLTPSTVT